MKQSKQRSIRGTRRRKPGAEEMLEVPPEWNEVPHLMMEEEDVLPEATGSTKWRQDEVSRGRRKQQKEDDIRPEKHGHSLTVYQRI